MLWKIASRHTNISVKGGELNEVDTRELGKTALRVVFNAHGRRLASVWNESCCHGYIAINADFLSQATINKINVQGVLGFKNRHCGRICGRLRLQRFLMLFIPQLEDASC